MNVTRKQVDLSGPPDEGHVSRVLRTPVTLLERGKPVVVSRRYGGDLTALHAAASTVRYPKHAKRTNGLPVKNRSFGFTTRNVIRGDYCSAASLARANSESHRALCEFAVELDQLYREALPEQSESHRFAALKRIHPDFRLGESLFTSGNANRNNAVGYHYDTGNFSGVCSAMIVLRNGASGGTLILPEFDVGLYLDDGDCLFFDGQGILHGVTPITLESPESYRISLVYYTLEQAWQCLPAGGELDRIKREKTQREQAIAGKVGYRGGKPEFRKRKDLPR